MTAKKMSSSGSEQSSEQSSPSFSSEEDHQSSTLSSLSSLSSDDREMASENSSVASSHSSQSQSQSQSHSKSQSHNSHNSHSPSKPRQAAPRGPGAASPLPPPLHSVKRPPRTSQCNDVVWVVVWVASLVGVAVVAGTMGSRSALRQASSPPSTSGVQGGSKVQAASGNTEFQVAIGVLFVMVLVAFFLGLGGLFCMVTWPAACIKLSLAFNMLILALMVIAGFVTGNQVMAWLGVVGFFIMGLFILAVWPRIPFSALLLGWATEIVRSHYGTIVITLLTSVLTGVWAFAWLLVVSATANKAGQAVYVYLLFALYFSMGVIANVCFVSVAGVAGSVYFNTGDPSPATSSLKRACTTSLGSICFGSLLVALVQTLKALVEMARGQKNSQGVMAIVFCILDCCMGCIESALRLFNKYVYARIGLYGQPYCDAAKDTSELIRSSGVDVLVSNDLTGMVVGMLSLAIGVITGVISFLWARSLYASSLLSYKAFILVCLSGFLIGLFIAFSILKPVVASVATVFVAYADDPAQMAVANPVLAQALFAEMQRRMIKKGAVATTPQV
jgi:hypothetical protein